MSLDSLLTEQRNPASENLDALSTFEMMRVMNHEDHKVADAVGRAIPEIAKAVDAIADRLEAGGRMFYVGAGTSGRLGVLDASECPPTFSVPYEMIQGVMAGGMTALYSATEASEDSVELGRTDLEAKGFTKGDVAVGIAASGRTPYVLGAIAYAKELGALTVGVSCTPHSQLSRSVDIGIEAAPGAEVVAGSTRLRAGTATKMVLNMLSTGVMVRLGHVYGNLMVNLKPSNEKLVDRARRIVSQAAGVPYEEAAQLLDAAGMVVKTAIVMGKLRIGKDEAEQSLRASHGRIRAVLAQEGLNG